MVGSGVRGLVVLTGWYAAALAALAAWLGPVLDAPDTCTYRVKDCWRLASPGLAPQVWLPALFVAVAVSLATLAVLTRRGGPAVFAGTAAAFAGWLAVPLFWTLQAAVVTAGR